MKVSHLHSNLSASRRTHDLRHVAATLALAAGVDLKVVQATLGHSTIALTANTYTSVLPQLAQAAAEAVAAAIPRRSAQPLDASPPARWTDGRLVQRPDLAVTFRAIMAATASRPAT